MAFCISTNEEEAARRAKFFPWLANQNNLNPDHPASPPPPSQAAAQNTTSSVTSDEVQDTNLLPRHVVSPPNLPFLAYGSTTFGHPIVQNNNSSVNAKSQDTNLLPKA